MMSKVSVVTNAFGGHRNYLLPQSATKDIVADKSFIGFNKLKYFD